MSNLAVSELAKLNPCHTWLGGEFRQPRHTSPYLAEPILGEVRKGGGIPYQKEVKPSVGEAIVGGCVPRRRTFLYTAAARCRLKNRQQVSSGRKAPSMPFPCWQERQGTAGTATRGSGWPKVGKRWGWVGKLGGAEVAQGGADSRGVRQGFPGWTSGTSGQNGKTACHRRAGAQMEGERR